MSGRILLALVIVVFSAHLSLQMESSLAFQGSSQIQQQLELPCDVLTDIQGGVMEVSRVRDVSGEKMCTVPASLMPKTMDEVLERNGLDAGAFAGSTPPCDGILLNKDMCLTRRQSEMIQQYRTLDNFHSRRWKRKALSSVTAKWTNNVVPYELAEGVFSTSETELIESAMRQWESGTCITFRPATGSDNDKVVIQSGTGCYSRIGRVGGPQELSLGTGICRTKRVIMHELGHALGLIHEHQRDDRDNFVRIRTENVQNQFLDQFNKISRSIVDVGKTRYDYLSLMHYGKSFFSIDGSSVTIETLDPNYQDMIGRVQTLSFTDYKSINLMYRCSEFCPQSMFCADDGYVGPNCACVCPDGTTSCTASTGSPNTNIVTSPIWEILNSIIPRNQLVSIINNRREAIVPINELVSVVNNRRERIVPINELVSVVNNRRERIVPINELVSVVNNRRERIVPINEVVSVVNNRRDDFPVGVSSQIPTTLDSAILSSQTDGSPSSWNPVQHVSRYTPNGENSVAVSRQIPTRENPAVFSRQILPRVNPAILSQPPTRWLTVPIGHHLLLNRASGMGIRRLPIIVPFPGYYGNQNINPFYDLCYLLPPNVVALCQARGLV